MLQINYGRLKIVSDDEEIVSSEPEKVMILGEGPGKDQNLVHHFNTQ